MWNGITYPFPIFSNIYWVWDYSSMLGLKLIHVSKRAPWTRLHVVNVGTNNFLAFTQGHLTVGFTVYMMTSSPNGNIFRVTGHWCEEFTGEFPTQRPVTRSFDVFFDLHLNKRLSKQSWGWWSETPSRPLWRHCDVHHEFDDDNHMTTATFDYGPWMVANLNYQYHTFANLGQLFYTFNPHILIVYTHLKPVNLKCWKMCSKVLYRW